MICIGSSDSYFPNRNGIKMKMKYLVIIFLGLQFFAGTIFAQAYPNRSIKVIVPYTPGGSVDNTCRLITEQLQKQLEPN